MSLHCKYFLDRVDLRYTFPSIVSILGADSFDFSIVQNKGQGKCTRGNSSIVAPPQNRSDSGSNYVYTESVVF